MIRRILTALVAALTLANGARMVLAPRAWYDSVPGVPATGPFNQHFVLDIGLAFLVSGGALALFAWRPRYRLAAATGAAFLALHGLLHVWGLLAGHSDLVAFELLLIVLPAAAAVAVVLPYQPPARRM